ncbi:EAL domain-containing protein [Halodurantibacterium flavum]|uniref:EAL domain-containing protein n=1 Tax=Halodurantibacterium flavum TaxID=1382802 RepID=A0ABW4S6U0_9RHOB
MTGLPPPPNDSPAADALDHAAALQRREAPAFARAALAEGRVELVLHPIHDARDLARIAFHEARPRLRDAGGRVIPPSDLAAARAETDLGAAIDCATLGLALAALGGRENLRLLLPLSPATLCSFEWRMTLEAGLRLDPSLADRLILGVDATAFAALPVVVSAFLDPLRGRGASLALCGFGAAPFTPRPFATQDFDFIQLDPRVVQGLADDARRRNIVAMLLSLARHSEAFVIASGVERAEDAAWLGAAGIDGIQGPAIPRPGADTTTIAEPPLRHRGT